MKLVMQAVKALLRKVNAVLAEHEARLEQLGRKYSALKGQKNIVLDLNICKCNMPFSIVAKMEPAEIQACLTVVCNQENNSGVQHRSSIIAVDKIKISYGGETRTHIMFLLATGRDSDESNAPYPLPAENCVSFYAYEWRGDTDLERLWVAQAAQIGGNFNPVSQIHYLYRTGENGYQYHSALHLKSPGNKTYELQVDDNGTLSTKKIV